MKKWIQHKAYETGDTILSHKDRSLSHLRGFGAHNAYHAAYNAAKTVYAREMMDAKISQKNLRVLRKVMHHLKRYDTQRITKIGLRYEGNTKKLSNAYSKLASQFEDDLKSFQESFSTLLLTIYNELSLTLQELSSQDKEVIALLEAYSTSLQQQGRIVPPEIIVMIEKSIEKLTKEEMRDARKEAREDDKMASGHHIKKGFGAALFGANYLTHKVRRLFKANEKAELRDAKKNIKELQEQLEHHAPKLTWLEHYKRHLENLEVIVKHQKNIAHDLLLLLDMQDEDYEEVMQTAELFISALGNEDSIRNGHLQKNLEAMRHSHDTIKKFLVSKKDAEKTYYKQAIHLHDKSQAVLEEIRNFSEQRMKQIREGKRTQQVAQ